MAINFKQIQKVIEKEAIGPIGEKHTVTIHQTGAVLDAGNPQDGTGATTDVTVEAVVIPIDKTNRRGDAVNIELGDVKVLIGGSVLTVDPSVGWDVTVDTVKYRVVDVAITRPGITTLLYTLFCER